MTEKQQLFVEVRDAWEKYHKSPFDFNEWLYDKHISIMKNEGFNSYQHMNNVKD